MAHQKPLLPGYGFMLLLVTLLVCWAAWTALHRTVKLDEITTNKRVGLPDMRLNINAATAAELSLLPGLGPKLAQRIVDDREQRGMFKSFDELKRVSGIGPAITERMQPHAYIGEASPRPR